jgi:hypothetical protein
MDREAFFFQDFEHTDVGQAPGAAAAQGDTDFGNHEIKSLFKGLIGIIEASIAHFLQKAKQINVIPG